MRAAPESQSEASDDAAASSAIARDGVVAIPEIRPPTTTATHALVTSLLSSARHELRSPLQSIQGFAELLESQAYGRLSSEQMTFVEHVLEGSKELGRVFDACLELTEEELLARPLEPSRASLRSLLADALNSAAASTNSTLECQFEDIGESLRAKLESVALKRALSCLLSALQAGQAHSFRVEFVSDAESCRLLLLRRGVARDALMPVRELAELRGTCRGLIWLRLADVLLAKQGALLSVGEQVDQAEVRIRLSSTH